jgi:2-(1,2-epoxy-1,2-dihydrophenyl)acetyl-CoA isomerase
VTGDHTATATTESLIGEGDVLLELDGAVGRLRMNRPEASNGLHVPMMQALYAALMRAHGEPRLRALVLSGEGKNFCAGGDVKTFASKGKGLPDYLREATSWLQICASALINLQAPVVTIVQGFAAGGGGLGLVCASDIVIAAESARFMSAATRVGMAPDAGSTVTLGRLVGHRKAMEIVLTNPIITAPEALEMGLVTRVVPDDQLESAGVEVARELSAGPTLAFAETKRLLWAGLGRSVEECLADEARTVARLSGTDDSLEGLAAVIERRDPVYKGS